jgi:hypothetical protein
MVDHPKPRFQFGIRTLLEIMAVVAFVLTVIYGRSSSGASGRYQMTTAGREHSQVLVLDSKTGKVWTRHFTAGSWTELPPAIPEFDK